MKAKVKDRSEVTVKMSQTEAGKLMYLMMYNVDWETDENGSVAEEFYNTLDDKGVREVFR